MYIYVSFSLPPDTVVLWHGMGDSCCNPDSMGKIKSTIEDLLPGTYVHSIQIGESDNDDKNAGFFGNVDLACQQLREDESLQGGFNAVGFSQCLRVSDIPGCLDPKDTSCRLMRTIARRGAYSGYVRDHVVQAQYYKDPDNIKDYLAKNIFLPDVNNELDFNRTYVQHLSSLHRLVLIRFTDDVTVKPGESAWFWFFDEFGDLIPLEEQPLWLEDWLGLRRLAERGKRTGESHLIFADCPGEHMRISLEYFEDEVIWPYLAEEEKPAKLDGDDEKRREQVIAMGSDRNAEIRLVKQDISGLKTQSREQ
ncbi:palmitoyl-protein thioesterase [Endogone sp. FLAS-F59071]|nr:palmitoyl-protein thioesterase [Endogone sp. FLAS-F59071]|eukprot:RUS20726.1 palmitoyl-protein thioesterase [Endogone sp. FLAS-F59071]